MIVSFGRFLILLIFFNGKPCLSADQYAAAVRWLSGQDYAQTHHLNQNQSILSLSPRAFRSGLSDRPLFSWDLPVDSKSTTEVNPSYPTLHVASIHTISGHRSDSNEIKGEKKHRQRTVWWPWKNYKDWTRSRTAHTNLKQFARNSSPKTTDQPRVYLRTKLKIKNKKITQKKISGRKLQRKKHNGKLKTPVHKISLQKHCEHMIIGMAPKFNDTDILNNKSNASISLNKKSSNELLKKYSSSNELKIITSNPDSEVEFKNQEYGNMNFSYTTFLLKKYQSNQANMFIKKKLHSKGYILECLNTECEAVCVNFRGSSICKCPQGFQLDTYKKKCFDINECSSRNGHGPCQGECTNTRGSYHCSCANVTGTRLASDGHSCEDIDECNSAANRLVCSHGCINTVGTAFCSCPGGYQLGSDWKTCQDVDECAMIDLQSMKCAGVRINTAGSYRCV